VTTGRAKNEIGKLSNGSERVQRVVFPIGVSVGFLLDMVIEKNGVGDHNSGKEKRLASSRRVA
jgi:hypothetical protein